METNAWLRRQVTHHDDVSSEEYDQSVLEEYAYFDGVIARYIDSIRHHQVSRLLDFGCGTGRITFIAARRGLTVVAIDISLGMVKKAKEKANAFRDGRVYGVVGDAAHLPFRDEAFDVVACAGVLHHIENIEAALEEQSRVLRGAGFLFIAEPSSESHRFSRLLHRVADRGFALANTILAKLRVATRYLPARTSPDERPIPANTVTDYLRKGGVNYTIRYYMHDPMINRFVPGSNALFRVLNGIWTVESGDLFIVTARLRDSNPQACPERK